jgi:CDP-glucose 4,6-dehydratase
MNHDFWRGRRVFITGHTGFKGSWLTHWLKSCGALITGYSNGIPTTPSLFQEANVADGVESIAGDVRDPDALTGALTVSKAEVVIHMAAQSLVRASYADPVATFGTNVLGTVNVLEAVRHVPSVRAAVVVTTDKCYENREWIWPYRENEALGGKDPYSSSKACAELVTAAYRASFFRGEGDARIATVRAGNVIGGGDWATDRLVPDLVRAFAAGEPARLRNPSATRPWQFVLDPLAGYLAVAEALWDGRSLADAWNFGPDVADARPVRWIANHLVQTWGDGAAWQAVESEDCPEASMLMLDSSRARTLLGWAPRVGLATVLDWIVEFYKGLLNGDRAAVLMDSQIARFEALHAQTSSHAGEDRP